MWKVPCVQPTALTMSLFPLATCHWGSLIVCCCFRWARCRVSGSLWLRPYGAESSTSPLLEWICIQNCQPSLFFHSNQKYPRVPYPIIRHDFNCSSIKQHPALFCPGESIWPGKWCKDCSVTHLEREIWGKEHICKHEKPEYYLNMSPVWSMLRKSITLTNATAVSTQQEGRMDLTRAIH